MRSVARNPYAVASAGLVAAGFVLAAVLALLPEAQRSALLFEVAKAAISFVPLVFFSVVIADIVRRRDADKIRSERRQEERKAFRRRLIAAYNESKAVRRQLRAAGLRPDSRVVLTEAHLATLDNLMRTLVDAQLAMEQLKRESSGPDAAFARSTNIADHLEQIEKYFNHAVREWEESRPFLRAGDPATVFSGWRYFSDFVASSTAKRLADSPTTAFGALEDAMLGGLGEAR